MTPTVSAREGRGRKIDFNRFNNVKDLLDEANKHCIISRHDCMTWLREMDYNKSDIVFVKLKQGQKVKSLMLIGEII